jgi:hypothetical protein
VLNVPNDKHSWIIRQLVLLATRLEIDLVLNGVTQVDLAGDHIRKRRSTGVWQALY